MPVLRHAERRRKGDIKRHLRKLKSAHKVHHVNEETAVKSTFEEMSLHLSAWMREVL